ncbi:ion transporter [Patescibacteria group bacterium]|nr:ion transporter [Patescibacteria group bacterium]
MRILGKFHSFAQKSFYEPDSKQFIAVNDVLSFLTILSVLAVVLESVTELSQYHVIFITVEWIAVIFFTLEYLGRLYTHPKPLHYAFSFFGIIDLLSIVPTYIAGLNLTALKTVRMLRILRFLRILRVSKVIRQQIHHVRSGDFEDFGAMFRLNALIYVTAVFTTAIIFGTLAYFFEHDNPSFNNIPRASLWALEAFLGGSISSRVTETDVGLVIGIFTRFAGLVLFAFLIHIVGNAVSYLLFGKERETRKEREQEKFE